MIIRQATLADIPRVMHILDIAHETMRRTGNPTQWPDTYPSLELVTNDVVARIAYVILHNGSIVATFTLIPSPEPVYAGLTGPGWLDDVRPYHVIHRVAAAPDVHGVFDAIIRFCESVTDNLRIDTHPDNVIMRHCILKHGFSFCGTVFYPGGGYRIAFQRLKNTRKP